MFIEEICEYNGQRVLLHPKKLIPVTPHDCGYDCDLVSKRFSVSREEVEDRPLEIKENWAMVEQWEQDLEYFED